MRAAVVVLAFLVGCHGGGEDVPTIDAAAPAFLDARDPCAYPGGSLSLLPTIECKDGALATASLDGTWMFTGTVSTTYDDADVQPYSAQIALERSGPAGCLVKYKFPATGEGTGVTAHADETMARESYTSPQGQHLYHTETVFCVSSQADDTLAFAQAIQSDMGGGHYFWRYRGVLTR